MSVIKKKYKYGGKKKYNLGGAIGMGAGAIAGSFMGNPLMGAQVGGMLGSKAQGLIQQGDRDRDMQPPPSLDPASMGQGYAGGGFLTGPNKMMLPEKSLKYGGKKKSKKKTGGAIDSGGRQFKKKKSKSLDAKNRDASKSSSDMMLNPEQKAYMKHKGGQEKPIGQDATKYEGKSHEQGGIDVDKNTEVEGGETKDNVGGGEYVFSKRVKVPGTYKTFAEVHEEMVKNNASPDQIERLAQMQEKVTGRQ